MSFIVTQNMAESIKLVECPRDAWQGLQEFIATEYKAEYLKELVVAGFRHIDAVSFVSPKHEKQMADSEEVMRSEEHTSELQSHSDLVCRLLLEKKKKKKYKKI